MSPRKTSKNCPRRAVHMDFHTMPGVYDVGAEFDPAAFGRTLADAGVDYITVFAKCNLGFAYYPTKIGTPHPGLKHPDLLGGMVRACHARGIRAAAYFQAGLDHEHVLRRREWCKVDKDGKIYDMAKMNHWFRRPCLNTGYRDYLLGMVREVLARYPVDGLFFDGLGNAPCYGAECLDGMRAAGLDIFREDDAKKFALDVMRRFQRDVEKLARAQGKPDLLLFFNGMPWREQPTHVEVEVIPTAPEYGYDAIPFMVRYARSLGRPVLTMTGRFHRSWRDFGGLRSKASLLFDCQQALSLGSACSVGDHAHPRARLEPAVYRRIGEVYDEVKKIEPWVAGAAPVSEMAVVCPALAEFPQNFYSMQHLRGAARLLNELKYQFDLCDGAGDLSGYRVLILPDNVTVDPGLRRKLQAHLRRGGVLVSSATAGLNPEKTRFALPAYKLDYLGPEPHHFSFFKAAKKVAADLPEMLTTIYQPGAAVRPRGRVETLAALYRPYFNQQSWDGYHENLYIPPEKPAGRPAAVRIGNILHFSFPLFTAYYEFAVPAYRQLFRNCVELGLPDPLLRTENMPACAQATVMRKGRQRLIHLLAYAPELRGRATQVIEEPLDLREVTVWLRRDGRPVRSARLALSGAPLPVRTRGEYDGVVVPRVRGYELLVLE